MSIDVYSWPTPNGHKVHIALEELGLPYTVHAINIGAGDQFLPDFLTISPNNKIPAILDPDGPDGKPFPVFESGAILIYLADKTGRLIGKPGSSERYTQLQWLMWQMGGLGPMLGQAHHFRQYAPEKIQYGIDRYTSEANRLYRVLDKRLSEARFLGGDSYSIADIVAWPWMRYPDRQGVDTATLPHFKRWFAEIAARPAVQRGVEVLAQHSR